MTAKKRVQWGGARPGAGRPKGSGSGPSPEARRHRVAVMLCDEELAALAALATALGKPLATVAYEFVARGLRSGSRRAR